MHNLFYNNSGRSIGASRSHHSSSSSSSRWVSTTTRGNEDTRTGCASRGSASSSSSSSSAIVCMPTPPPRSVRGQLPTGGGQRDKELSTPTKEPAKYIDLVSPLVDKKTEVRTRDSIKADEIDYLRSFMGYDRKFDESKLINILITYQCVGDAINDLLKNVGSPVKSPAAVKRQKTIP